MPSISVLLRPLILAISFSFFSPVTMLPRFTTSLALAFLLLSSASVVSAQGATYSGTAAAASAAGTFPNPTAIAPPVQTGFGLMPICKACSSIYGKFVPYTTVTAESINAIMGQATPQARVVKAGTGTGDGTGMYAHSTTPGWFLIATPFSNGNNVLMRGYFACTDSAQTGLYVQMSSYAHYTGGYGSAFIGGLTQDVG